MNGLYGAVSASLLALAWRLGTAANAEGRGNLARHDPKGRACFFRAGRLNALQGSCFRRSASSIHSHADDTRGTPRAVGPRTRGGRAGLSVYRVCVE